MLNPTVRTNTDLKRCQAKGRSSEVIPSDGNDAKSYVNRTDRFDITQFVLSCSLHGIVSRGAKIAGAYEGFVAWCWAAASPGDSKAYEV